MHLHLQCVVRRLHPCISTSCRIAGRPPPCCCGSPSASSRANRVGAQDESQPVHLALHTRHRSARRVVRPQQIDEGVDRNHLSGAKRQTPEDPPLGNRSDLDRQPAHLYAERTEQPDHYPRGRDAVHPQKNIGLPRIGAGRSPSAAAAARRERPVSDP